MSEVETTDKGSVSIQLISPTKGEIPVGAHCVRPIAVSIQLISPTKGEFIDIALQFPDPETWFPFN